MDTVVASRAWRSHEVFDGDGAHCGGGERDGHGDRSGGLGNDAADGGEADGGGGHLIVGEVERGGGTARIAACGEGKHDGLGALGKRILRGRNGQIHAGRAGGNRDGAGKRLVIDAVSRGAGDRVVHGECRGGAAGAREIKLAGGSRALGERGDAVVRRAVGIDEDGGLLIVVEPERRGAGGVPKLIRGTGRECDDDGLEVFGERVVDRGDGDVDDVIAAASSEGNGAGKRGIVGAGSGGAADGVVDGDGGFGTAAQGEAELTGGGGLARTRERDDFDVGQVTGVGDRHTARADRTEAIGAAAAGGELHEHVFSGLAERIEARRDDETGAGFAGGQRDGARERLVIDAVEGGAGECVVDGERRGDVATARNDEDGGIGHGAGHG